MQRELIFDLVKVTEAAALAAAPLCGIEDEKLIDKAAVEAMRQKINKLKINAKVVIGEGERDQAPMLNIGEDLGLGVGPNLDIAVDPIEGTTLAAKNQANSLSVLALAEAGGLLAAPDIYMDKIVVGAEGKGVVDLDATPAENVQALARAKNKDINDMVVTILNRERHQEIIKQVREVGAKVNLISAVDIRAGIAANVDYLRGDMLLGIGGAPEGVLTAVAVKCLGGDMQARLLPANKKELSRSVKMGHRDPDKLLKLNDLVSSQEVVFIMTGVTDGEILTGVKSYQNQLESNSLLLSSKPQIIRYIRELKKKTAVNFDEFVVERNLAIG